MTNSTLKAEIKKEFEQEFNAEYLAIYGRQKSVRKELAKWLGQAIDKATKSALEAVLPEEQEYTHDGFKWGDSDYEANAVLFGKNAARNEMITRKDKYLSEI